MRGSGSSDCSIACFKRAALLLFAALMLVCLNAGAEDFPFQVQENPQASPVPPPAPSLTPLHAEGPPPFEAWPPLDRQGFLPAPRGNEEFIFTDEKLGRWIYLSADLRVDIRRFSARVKSRGLVWYLADVLFRGEQVFRAVSADPANPSRALSRPEVIAANNRMVYAQNGDLFSWRLYNRDRTGLIIRDGKVLHENTYTHAVAKIPPLDELALFPDGHVEMRVPGELDAQGYLDRGAADVLAFGPILFRDGVMDSRLDGSFTHLEPRSAIGIIGPGHFVGIMVEGRNKRSAGSGLRFVADRLLEAGCHEAFTLDGGQTAAMVFMGKNVMDPGTYNGFHNTRRQQDVIGIGRTDAVKAE